MAPEEPHKSQPDQTARRRRNRRRRIVVYGGLIAAIWGFWIWQPWELDIFERPAPHPNPMIDPDSKRLFSKGTKVLIVTAHPDDSEFYVGGTLAKLRDAGAEIHQVIVTDGDKAYYGRLTNVDENRRLRHAEALEAARRWGGTDLLFLGYQDGRLKNSDKLVGRLRDVIISFQPEYVLAFDFDFPPRISHKDHRVAGQVVSLALDKPPSSVRWLLRFSTSQPNYVVDISDYWAEKEELLKIHRSQFAGKIDQITNMVQGMAVEDGERIDRTYGEGFRATPIK